MQKLLTSLSNILPDLSGIFLAALGVALVIFPEWVERFHKRKKTRLFLAAFLVVIGGAGLLSSYHQHVENDAKQAENDHKQTTLQADVTDLRKVVEAYGPKLDAIIKNPFSKDQHDAAVLLQSELEPRMQIGQPAPRNEATRMFVSEVTNTGRLPAKGVKTTYLVRLATESKAEEAQLFHDLYAANNQPDLPSVDVQPGYAGRLFIPYYIPPFSQEDEASLRNGSKVLYMVALITYFNEAGREFRAESCSFGSPYQDHLISCDDHNKVE